MFNGFMFGFPKMQQYKQKWLYQGLFPHTLHLRKTLLADSTQSLLLRKLMRAAHHAKAIPGKNRDAAFRREM
ncbi:MAG: hypothetical protein HY937_02610 [Nitrosomonadales bacterium]|nr:hypothetical protein [Nitrosomonadales bacterium]